jgi:hypothetical protein
VTTWWLPPLTKGTARREAGPDRQLSLGVLTTVAEAASLLVTCDLDRDLRRRLCRLVSDSCHTLGRRGLVSETSPRTVLALVKQDPS